jgi:hypothetical protein
MKVHRVRGEDRIILEATQSELDVLIGALDGERREQGSGSLPATPGYEAEVEGLLADIDEIR